MEGRSSKRAVDDEDEVITVEEDEMCKDNESFSRTLVGKLRSEGLAKKLGNSLGNFEEMDLKECNRMGKFLRIRVSLDLRKPLKRGSKHNFQGKEIWVDYKYERLPKFCFACGRIGHQMRDCEDIEDHHEHQYSDLEEKQQAFGPWLRASPLPKSFYEVKNESSSSSCSKSLFPSTSNSKGTVKEMEEEVEQQSTSNRKQSQQKPTEDNQPEKCRGADNKGRERAGLAFMWMENLCVNISSYSINHIHGWCDDEETGEHWGITDIYGYLEEQNKWKTWLLVGSLARHNQGRWLCCGDFNDILDSQEKQVRNVRSRSQLSIGRQIVAESSLIDLGFEGYPFTWSNGREEGAKVQCRLDRALANVEFINRFSPIRESWNKEAQCEEIIRNNWNLSSLSCLKKLESLQSLGSEFGDHNLGMIKKELLRIKDRLKDQSLWSDSIDDHHMYKEPEKQHGELLKRQETMWRQRSRAVWLKNGDRNTKFFHNKASQRSKVNNIQKIIDEDGVWWRGEEQVEKVFINYFEDLFSSSNPSNIAECEMVKGKLSNNHKTWCEMEYTREEVK
ncbi:unnamed protein product [Trifolium pratense]|uniref:Uncharacterized protein n=1 Tax=Trifolium pratense TaxID=57577 RepID=A0ACB0ISV3_TRIPR|nr:unnamed protein product [Trifolium pratense]